MNQGIFQPVLEGTFGAEDVKGIYGFFQPVLDLSIAPVGVDEIGAQWYDMHHVFLQRAGGFIGAVIRHA